MSGFDENRFIDLSERELNHLSCSICLNIYDTAVISECGHSFCKGCVRDWIEKFRNRVCPTCKTLFTRKRLKSLENVVIIGGYIFKPNFTANGIISELNTKCDFEFNGCQQKIKFGLLSAHIKECPHRFCRICGAVAGTPDVHNCLEEMKTEVQVLKKTIETMDELNLNLNRRAEKFKNKSKYLKVKCNEAILENSVLRMKIEQDHFKFNQIYEQNSKLSADIELWKHKYKELNEGIFN